MDSRPDGEPIARSMRCSPSYPFMFQIVLYLEILLICLIIFYLGVNFVSHVFYAVVETCLECGLHHEPRHFQVQQS